MNTTAGSYALRLSLQYDKLIVVDTVVPRDATVVEKLRKAGAIILGKANFRQWGGCQCWIRACNYLSMTILIVGYPWL
jgi:Asp-tRNA(Asn)/Glu-tRNA(Gln) amidotransferase A subunit family amidase